MPTCHHLFGLKSFLQLCILQTGCPPQLLTMLTLTLSSTEGILTTLACECKDVNVFHHYIIKVVQSLPRRLICVSFLDIT